MLLLNHSKYFLLFISILYFYSLFIYPLTYDEAIFSVMGKSMHTGQLLYKDIVDNKPPGIYILFYFLGFIPTNEVFILRLPLLISISFTAFFIFETSKKLFPTIETKYFLLIPSLYLLCSVFFVGGLTSLTESYSSLFTSLSLYFFISGYLNNNKNSKNYLIKTSLAIFVGAMFNQSALIFLIIPCMCLFFYKQYSELFVFLFSFLLLCVITLYVFYSLGIFEEFIEYTITFNINYAKEVSSPLIIFGSIALAYGFIGTTFIPGVIGLLSLKNDKKNSYLFWSFLIALLVSLAFAATRNTIVSRHHMFPSAILLLVFVPLGVQILKNKIFLSESISKLLLWISVFSLVLLLLFFGFVILKLNGVLNGYTIQDESYHISKLNEVVSSESCKNILSFNPIYYYFSGQENFFTKRIFDADIELKQYGSEKIFYNYLVSEYEHLCFVVYIQEDSFYSIPGIYNRKIHANTLPLYSLFEENCECKYLQQLTSNSSVCYNCVAAK